MTAIPEAEPQYFLRLLGWAVYLACSWTWCIGMYLPVVLLDHYRWPGVVAFAIPNVAGVVLFGLGVGTAARSRAMIAGNRGAMLWFSLITIAFHVYFLAAVWGYEFPHASALLTSLVPLPVVAAAWLTRRLSDRSLVRLAAGVYVLSWALMYFMTSAGAAYGLREPVWAARPESGVVFLAPALVIGFLLCPYLDLTFHRAFKAVGGRGPGKTTFALFGVVFSMMLLFTFYYSLAGFRWPVIVHILVQSWFTMTVHFKELDARAATSAGEAVGRWTGPVLGISWLLAMLPIVDYRWWFLFTGLIFPAYVALVMVRRRLGQPAAHQAVLALAVAVLTPFAALSFLVGGLEWLALVPSVALVLAMLARAPVAAAPAGALEPAAHAEPRGAA
ncbi:MAG: hypothetical protein IT430_06290 [Phycisphaerales bacterium]|nr:hypothetical protein [Phycisphaerales bacterium]